MYIKSKNKMFRSKNKIQKLSVYAFLLVLSLSSLPANAQCSMCRAALTSEGNTKKAEAVNDPSEASDAKPKERFFFAVGQPC